MRTLPILMAIVINLIACAEEKPEGDYPVIDVIGQVEKYQRAYCSDYFSSIELIQLETGEDFLLDILSLPRIKMKDDFIFMPGNGRLYAFETSGKFLHQIGDKGQGPGEYQFPHTFFLHPDKPIIYVESTQKIIEYDFQGNFISYFYPPKADDGKILTEGFCVEDELFGGSVYNNGKNKYKYYLFDRNGTMLANLPNRVFFNREKGTMDYDGALPAFRVDDTLYLKDFVNDTLYTLADLHLRPAYVFEFGEYAYPIEDLEIRNPADIKSVFPFNKAILFQTGPSFVGTPGHFFYSVRLPGLFSLPKTKPTIQPLTGKTRSVDPFVFGIYDIEKKTNMLLDTDQHHQKGIVNDLNGGLPVFPRYYAGDNLVVDVWNAEEMKEMLTEEYFEKQTIKDQEGHQKLKKILTNLKEDDNPVVVVARLK